MDVPEGLVPLGRTPLTAGAPFPSSSISRNLVDAEENQLRANGRKGQCTPAELVREIHLLCDFCRGPIPIRTGLRSWAADFEAGDASCIADDRLRSALEKLVVLSLSSTAFPLGPGPRTFPPTHDVEMFDLGGSFAALFIARELLALVHEPERRAQLELFLQSEFDRQMSQIRSLAVF